jgi:hypothetical protein
MKYAVEMGYDAMTYITSFIKTFTHSKVNREEVYIDSMEIAQTYFMFSSKQGK